MYIAAPAAISHLQSKYIAFAMQIYRTERSEVKIERNSHQMGEGGKTIKEHAIELTVEVTELCEAVKAKSVYTNQLLRAASSIGANAHEAKYAESRADFVHKLEIALKECYEAGYWLEVLHKVGSLSEEQFKAVSRKCGTIRRKLIASITTAKENERNQ